MGRSSSSSSKRLTTALVGIGLILVAAVLVVTHGPFNLINQKFLTIGVLYDASEEIDRRYIEATNEAVRDILKLVDEQGFLSKPVPPIYLKFKNETETAEEALARLYNEGVKIFIGYNTENYEQMTGNTTTDIIILSTSQAPHNQHHNIHQVSPSSTLLANSFLHLINSTNPKPGNPMDVLPVMRDEAAAAELYRKLVVAVKNYPDVTLMNPVVYNATQYPRSDAFEVVSSIGSFVAIKPEAEVFMLSPEDLHHIMGVTHVNPTLQKRRWFAVGAARYEEDIQASSRGRRMASQVSLTTLTFLGVGDTASQEARIRGKYLGRAFDKKEVKGTVYEELQAYELVIKLHRAFAYSELNSGTNLSTSIKNVFDLKNGGGQEVGMFASMFLMPSTGSEVEFIPKMKWLVEGVVNVSIFENNSSVTTYEEVRTSPLTRTEVENLYELKKPTCPNPIFSVDIKEKSFLPSTSLTYTLNTFPKAVILPVAGGITVGVHCKTDLFKFSCVQSKYDSGDLACLAASDGMERDAKHRKHKRAIEEGEDNEVKLNATLGELQFIEAEFDGVIGSWQKLVPSVVGCYASVAGCDFCYYFLAIYNLSITPAVCNGGCALGVLGSCSALLTDSLAKTVLN